MIGRRAVRSSIAVMTALGASGAFVLAPTGGAAAAGYSCSGPKFTAERVCTAPVAGDAPLFTPSNKLWVLLSVGTVVTVTCWYYGSSAGYENDGFEDHVTHEDMPNPITGHIPDDYVNFNDNFPDGDTVGLPQCG